MAWAPVVQAVPCHRAAAAAGEGCDQYFLAAHSAAAAAAGQAAHGEAGGQCLQPRLQLLLAPLLLQLPMAQS
jgi:hypothetical protein